MDDAIDTVVNIKDHFFEDKCADWAAKDAANPGPIDTIPCPCTTTQMTVHIGSEFQVDPGCNPGKPEGCATFHPGATICYRSIEPRYDMIGPGKSTFVLSLFLPSNNV